MPTSGGGTGTPLVSVSSLYDLQVQGARDLMRTVLRLSQRRVSRDPLVGVVDGTNRIFHTTYAPVLTGGSLRLFLGSTLTGGSVDYETGEVTMGQSPLSQPYATYTFVPFTQTQMIQILMWGFEEMELRWPREWRLEDATGSPAQADDVQIFVTDKDGNDPNCGGTLFSLNPIQIGFFLNCVEYRYLLDQQVDGSYTNFDFRESRGGASIQKSRIAPNVELTLARLDERLVRAMRRAQDQQYTDGSHLGGFNAGVNTQDYFDNYQWQSLAIPG